MNLAPLWLSAPAAVLLGDEVDNDGVLVRVRERFTGTDEEWQRVERRVRSLWRICGTQKRHLCDDPDETLASRAAEAAGRVLGETGVGADALDLVIYGSIARTYYEPATASEVAARIGATRAMPLDVTSACAGSLLATQDAIGRLTVDPALQRALICTGTMTGRHVTYALGEAEDVGLLGAGLTLGHAATAMLLTREPTPRCGRVVGMLAEGMPEHWGLCKAPVDGVFQSDGVKIFALSRFVPGHVRKLCERVGWSPADVDVFVAHQPSNRVLHDIAKGLEVDPSRIPPMHHLFGNTADSAVPLGLRHLLDEGIVRPGMKIVMSTAASGFVMASIAVHWEK